MSLESRKNKYVFHSSISEKHYALKVMFSISTINKTMCHKWVSKACKTDVKKPFIIQRPITSGLTYQGNWIWNNLNPLGSNLNISLVIKNFMEKGI